MCNIKFCFRISHLRTFPVFHVCVWVFAWCQPCDTDNNAKVENVLWKKCFVFVEKTSRNKMQYSYECNIKMQFIARWHLACHFKMTFTWRKIVCLTHWQIIATLLLLNHFPPCDFESWIFFYSRLQWIGGGTAESSRPIEQAWFGFVGWTCDKCSKFIIRTSCGAGIAHTKCRFTAASSTYSKCHSQRCQSIGKRSEYRAYSVYLLLSTFDWKTLCHFFQCIFVLFIDA